jgi:hypothetical protein
MQPAGALHLCPLPPNPLLAADLHCPDSAPKTRFLIELVSPGTARSTATRSTSRSTAPGRGAHPHTHVCACALTLSSPIHMYTVIHLHLAANISITLYLTNGVLFHGLGTPADRHDTIHSSVTPRPRAPPYRCPLRAHLIFLSVAVLDETSIIMLTPRVPRGACDRRCVYDGAQGTTVCAPLRSPRRRRRA